MIVADSIPRLPGIYVIRNVVNGKLYAGSAASLYDRFHNHASQLRLGRHHNKHLLSSYRKHGAKAFVFWTAELCTRETLLEREQWWLDMFRPFGARGYNTETRAGNSMGRKHSEETRAKIRAKALGRVVSEESRLRQSLQRKGIAKPPRSQEHCQKIRLAKLGKKHGPMPQAHKAAIARALMGHATSEETCRKISEARLGHPNTPEVAARIGDKLRGRKQSPEQIAKARAARWGR